MKHVFTLFTSLLLLLVSGAHAQQWTWLTGGNTPNVLPNYVDDPGGRQGSAMWSGNDAKVYVFGGNNFEEGFFYADLWAYDTLSQQWTFVSGSQEANAYGIYGTQGISDAMSHPGARQQGASWVDNNGNLWLFGGLGYGASTGYGELNDLWMYSVQTGLWTWVSGSSETNSYGMYGELGVPASSNSPGSRHECAFWLLDNDLYLFGGSGLSSLSIGYLNDLWKYSIQDNQWVYLSGSITADVQGNYGSQNIPSATNQPGARAGSCQWESENNSMLYLFGGSAAITTEQLNDLWQFDVTTNTWTWISGTSVGNHPGVSGELGVPSVNNIPAGRLQAVSFAQNNYLWLFGGYTNYYINDLWRYNIATAEWTWMGGDVFPGDLGVYIEQGPSTFPNYPSNKEAATGCVSDSGKFWLFGGTGSVGGVMNDLWKLEVAPDAPMMTCNPLPANLQNGLVGYWPFCGNANDESGNGNNGVVNGATLTEDRFGNAGSAYDFNAISSNILTTLEAPSAQNPRSFSLWFQTDSINNTNDKRVMLTYGGDAEFTAFDISIWNQPSFGIAVDAGATYIVYSAAFVGSAHHHLAVTYDSADGPTVAAVKVYLDGVLLTDVIAETASFEFNTGNQRTVRFGPNPSIIQPLQTFYGILDDIGIWNRALTAEEVALLYGNFTQPVAGCTDLLACNYNSSATEDDGSCQFSGSPCDDANASTINDIIDASCGCVGTPIELGVEHTCGAPLVHNPSLTYGSMTDQEGNVYKTIVIGDQEWMAENLTVSTYSNGEEILTGLTPAEWNGASYGAYKYYNEESNYNCPLGKLYNWYAISDPRNVCPTGWHIPTNAEWAELISFLGGEEQAAAALKASGVSYWHAGNNGTNNSGFAALAGGYYDYNLSISSDINNYAYYWTATPFNSYSSYYHYFDTYVNNFPGFNIFGFSARCTRDPNTGFIPGCNDGSACNFNASATVNDGSCLFIGSPCDDGDVLTVNDSLNSDCVCVGEAVTLGIEHTCGADFVHNPSLTYGSMTDQEGNVYKTIVIGDQEWMAENLNTSIYRNGDAIVTGMTNEEWSTTDVGAWAYQFDNSAISCPYGKLYNWFACVDSRNLCPTGWHVPSDGDWAIMIEYLGGEWEAGWSMKSTGSSFNGTGLWSSWNEEATNSSGFSAIPGGVRSYSGIYNWYGQTGYWWSSSESGPDNAWVRFLNINMVNSGNDNGGNKKDGFSVRCLRDSDTGLIPGCLDLLACNYNPNATEEDGSCYYPGCIDPLAFNYNPLAGCNDGSCIYTPIPGCTDPLAFNYNPQANQNEGCLYTASVFVYNDLNGNGDHESNEPGLSNWPVVGNDINGLLWTNGNGNAFVAVPQGAYQFTVLNTTDNWVLTTEASGILSVGSNNCTDQAGNPVPCPNPTLSFGLQVIPGEAIVAAGPFTGFWDILHCTDGYESGVYLENIGSQTVSGFMTLTCDPLFTPNASSYFTTPPAETGPGYALWNIEDFLPGEYELLSYFVPGPGVEYLNAVFNFSLELTLLDPQGNIIYDETWDASPIVACAYDPNDLTGYPEGLSAPHKEGYTIEHFMRPDNMVEFRVRFQNTGTLPAEDIDIYIPIDASVWDLSTIEPLARAADMQVICLHDSGDNFFNLYDSLEHELPEGVSASDLLIFSFEDIFLPDSASDPGGSQGYVFFQMQAKHGLDVNTELNAQAFIYFEQNPPITTNETYHVIFDCESFTPMVGDTEICDGESLIFDATQPYVDAYEWQLNNVVIGSANTLQYPAEVGTYTLELNTKNVLCSPGENHDVTVIVHEIPELDLPLDETVCEGDPIILEAVYDGSITWSNGLSTGDTLIADTSFTVTVTVAGEGGCSISYDWSVTVNPLPNAGLIDDGDILVIGGVAWQWYFNGEEILGATANSISPDDAGNYYVIVTSEEGCTVQSETVVIDPDNVFVHSWSTLHLYPNPMKDLARIELPQGTFDIALYDITGACIRTLPKQQGTVVIERESLASGVYQLQVSQGEVMKSVRLVVE